MGRRLAVRDLEKLRLPSQPAISPDGERVVYVLGTTDAQADEDRYRLWLVRAGADAPVQLTRGDWDTAPAWSPDGSRIAFLRRGGGAPAQVWLAPADGGEPVQLTSRPLGAGAPVWSPDGSRIAFVAAVDTAAAPGEGLDAGAKRRETAPVVIDRLAYKADGVGLFGMLRDHLFVVRVETGEVRQLTGGDVSVGESAWSPDGRQLVFTTAAVAEDADLTLVSAAYRLDLTQADPRPVLVGPRNGRAGTACWTADGSALLVVGREDVAVGHERLLRVPLDGGPAVDLLPGLDRNVMAGAPGYPGARPRLTRDGRRVLCCVRDRGRTHLYAVDVAGGDPVCVIGGDDIVLSGLSVAATADRAAVIVTSPTSYGEVALVDLTDGSVHTVTGHTAESIPDVELFPAEPRSFTISDGLAVEGWLVRDPAAPTPGPLLLDVHGGPHNAWNGVADPVHGYHQELAARGWAVLLLNSRGSDGYGEAFFRATTGAWGVADAVDFLEPIDELVAEGIADPQRLAVAGYSYGGFMTCSLTGRTDRFAAAVAGGAVTDMISLAGTSDDGHGLAAAEFGGIRGHEPGRYAAMSPITRVATVRTPTLILHGTADERCPVGQAEQWFSALRERGVPTRLVQYPGGAHAFILDGRPSHRRDYNQRIIDWLTEHTTTPSHPVAVGVDARSETHWQARLAELAVRHGVPGAVLGISHGDSIIETACGVLNTATGVAATADSLFQIGSITKVWTTTLIMQLVDEGTLELDAPVTDVLPKLRLGSPGLAKRVTTRHLLAHTSGIDGDVFIDTGRGDDCIERYVTALADVAENHPLGATMSYCNAGFVLAGRIIEQLTGTTWDIALRDRLIRPLGLSHTVTLPEDAIRFRAATGHVAAPGEPLRPSARWQLPRSCGPAGLISSTARDVLAFARLHLSGGRAADGTRVVSADSVAAMRERQIGVPDPYTYGDAWGLGWALCGWDGHRLAGHDGGTIGQAAFLRMFPEHGLAVVLLTNGGHARSLYQDLYREVVHDLAGVAMPRPLEPPADAVALDVSGYAGSYERAGTRLEFTERDGRLALTTTVTGELAHLLERQPEDTVLIPVRENLFVTRNPHDPTWTPVTFYEIADGSPYVHMGGRATPKRE